MEAVDDSALFQQYHHSRVSYVDICVTNTKVPETTTQYLGHKAVALLRMPVYQVSRCARDGPIGAINGVRSAVDEMQKNGLAEDMHLR